MVETDDQMTDKIQSRYTGLGGSGLNNNDCQVDIGNHFEKWAADSWPLVAISGNHFLTYKNGDNTQQKGHLWINEFLIFVV